MRWLLSTESGLEPVVAEEAAAACPDTAVESDPRVRPGTLVLSAPDHWSPRVLRTIHHAALVRAEGEAHGLDELRTLAAGVEVPELATAASFRVTARGEAPPGATLDQAAGAVGAALIRRHGTRVDLVHHEVDVRVELVAGRVLLAARPGDEDLAKRILRPRPFRAALSPTVAAAMVRLAGVPGLGAGSFLDPTCGSGTLVVEAHHANPALATFASDWDAKTVQLARETLAAHGVNADVRCLDARRLAAGWGRRFDVIATNLPFGYRVGGRIHVADLYAAVLPSCVDVLEAGGRLVLLTPRLKALARALAGLPLEIERELFVGTGGFRPLLRVLRARASTSAP